MTDNWKTFVSPAPQGPKVLVLDDDKRTLNGIVERLARQGYNAIPILEGTDLKNLDELTSIIEARNPAALITDSEMLHFSGNDVCQHIKKAFPQLPVVLYSASRTNVEDAPNHGFNDAVLKGVGSADDLSKALVSQGIFGIPNIIAH